MVTPVGKLLVRVPSPPYPRVSQGRLGIAARAERTLSRAFPGPGSTPPTPPRARTLREDDDDMGRRQTRGLKAIKAIRAAIPDGVELDEVDEDVLLGVRRAYDRAEALDEDLARERAEDKPSANRIALLSAEVRLQEVTAEKWGRQVIDRAENVIGGAQKSWQHQKAAKARWSGQAANTAGR